MQNFCGDKTSSVHLAACVSKESDVKMETRQVKILELLQIKKKKKKIHLLIYSFRSKRGACCVKAPNISFDSLKR